MKKIAFLGLVFTLVAAPSLAEGMYVGVKLGQANYDYSNVTNNDQSAVGFLFGTHLGENAAVEVEYNNLGGFDSNTSNFSGSSFSLNGIGLIQINPQFSLFGKLGLASTTLKDQAKPGYSGGDVSYANTGLNLGLGVQFNISPQVSVRAGLDSFKVGNSMSTTGKTRMLYLGALLKF
jgi:OOP family OmpA-OmpF porin